MSLDEHAARIEALEDAKKDHEGRLRSVERLIQWFIGAAAAAGFMFGLLSEAIKRKLGLA